MSAASSSSPSSSTLLTREDCDKYKGVNYPINSNFYFVNGHGYETEDNMKILRGVRIVMFCYSGRILNVCPKFDKFNWSHILIDPVSSSNYCNFLASISDYSSIKDHFCIYEEGDIIKNINMSHDENFREGVYRLPVKGFAYDQNTETIVVSSHTSWTDIQKDDTFKELLKKSSRKHIRVDDKKLAELLRNKTEFSVIQSSVKSLNNKTSLSNLIRSMLLHENAFTILLMICREGTVSYQDISQGKKVSDGLIEMKNELNIGL